MFARRKKELSMLNASQNSSQPAESNSSSAINNKNSNGTTIIGRKSMPAPTLMGSPSSGFPVGSKREDKGTVMRRSAGSGPPQPQGVPVDNSAFLGEMIPRMKSTLFSTDTNNVQKTRELKRLLSCMNEWGNINDQTMLKLIENLKENVEMLDDKMTILVHQILDANWCSRSGKVVKAFEDFISELLVIRPMYAGTVLQSLIRKFLPSSYDNFNPDEIPIADQKVFDVAHRNLKKLLEAFPRIKESCLKTMGNSYPYMLGRSPFVHYCYVKNLLDTLKYAPHLKCQILQLIIHKLSRMDVNVPREEVEALNEMIKEEELSEEVKGEDGNRIDVKIDKEQFLNSLIGRSSNSKMQLVNILDLCLSLVFECLQSIVNECAEQELDSFYDSMFDVFEREIIPSFGVNHVQFLYFYLINVQPSYAQKLLEFLWKRAINVNTPVILRMQFMAYIAGILSRGTCISVKILKRWLTRMAEWANIYVDQRVKNSHWSSVNIQTHGPFYAVCQAIFYVFAFRNKDLIGSKKCTAFTGTLNLGRLVTCDLNPLKAIVEPVAVAFVNAAHTHQISYCRTVLERNQRATIPTSVRESLSLTAMDTVGAASDTLETFFPFDPFLLPRSRKWVDSSYRVYEAYLPEVKIEKEERSPSHWSNSHHNEDSIDMELSNSFRDRDGSHFVTAGFMDSSDIRDEDEFMDQ